MQVNRGDVTKYRQGLCQLKKLAQPIVLGMTREKQVDDRVEYIYSDN